MGHDRGAEEFGEISRDGDYLHHHPEALVGPGGVGVAAVLGEVLARGYAELGRRGLHEDCDDVARKDHPE